MDEHGLPIVGAGVDYTKVPALEHKKTLLFLNQFIIHSTQFLNRFSTVCEQRLTELSHRIQRLDISLNILEAKLSSIEHLDSVQATSQYQPPEVLASAGATTAARDAPPSSTGTGPPPPSSQPPPPPGAADEPIPPPQAQPEAAEPSKGKKAKDDPKYQKFFKMKRLGVNPLQIAMEMKRVGLNPDIIEDEDAELPEDEAGGTVGVAGGDSDSDSSASNSDDSDSDDSFDSTD